MKLYSYYRSSAAYRVRIAMNLKAVDYDLSPVNLLESEQCSEQYKTINAEGLVPCLETSQGVLSQSLAILEWLEEQYPLPAILPADRWLRAQARSFAYGVSCDIHPVNNLRILKYLQNELDHTDEKKNEWYQHWIKTGFISLEQQMGDTEFCYTDTPGIADICLVPQVFNALRFKVDMSPYPKLHTIYQRCNELDAFIDAAPENQPDAV
ncbi:maleylacetoacetate isomerase [Endozoicomonas sp. (ex Bugula neritina AB1)]|nr:maleylacetoacetate isomerase [Endozoicomonas sp. (ex Bugula neritina AB1)]